MGKKQKKKTWKQRIRKKLVLTGKDYLAYAGILALGLVLTAILILWDEGVMVSVYNNPEVFAFSFPLRLLIAPVILICTLMILGAVLGVITQSPLVPSKKHPADEFLLEPADRKKWAVRGAIFLGFCVLLLFPAQSCRREYRTYEIAEYNIFGAETETISWSDITSCTLYVDTHGGGKHRDPTSQLVLSLSSIQGRQYRIKDKTFRNLDALLQFPQLLAEKGIEQNIHISQKDWLNLTKYGDYSDEDLRLLAEAFRIPYA